MVNAVKFAHTLNKIQSGCDLQCLILCSFEITCSYNVTVHLIMHVEMKSKALCVYSGSKRCYKLADDIANQYIALRDIFPIDETVSVFLV
jgi:hypothetical protein